MSDSDDNALAKSAKNPSTDLATNNSLHLGGVEKLDLSGLSQNQIEELKHQYHSGMIDIHKKAQELKVDAAALDAVLHNFNDQTERATQAGNSATITHTQTTSIGRTEIIIGNTEKAAQGKISRSGSGLPDNMPLIIGIIAAAAVIVALVMN
uniref:hypothetical protein n=1 Tax=Pararhizobium sp. IMCC3301 TaxID=3067904 RepID=UPI002741679C|nr:hypothetical protein [Pararhizobium sp. IMCC3301]